MLNKNKKANDRDNVVCKVSIQQLTHPYKPTSSSPRPSIPLLRPIKSWTDLQSNLQMGHQMLVTHGKALWGLLGSDAYSYLPGIQNAFGNYYLTTSFFQESLIYLSARSTKTKVLFCTIQKKLFLAFLNHAMAFYNITVITWVVSFHPWAEQLAIYIIHLDFHIWVTHYLWLCWS